MTSWRGEVRPHKRRGFWYFIRRVPDEYSAHDDRNPVTISTGIRIADDPRGVAAKVAVKKLNATVEHFWRDKAAGRNVEAEALYQNSLLAARKLGLPYQPATDVSELSVDLLVQRILKAKDRPTDETHVSGVLGGAELPQLKLSELLDEFERISSASLIRKSERQKIKWRRPKQLAITSFIDVLGGDRTVASLTRLDALAFRQHWQDRIGKGEVEIETANKNMGHVAGMLRTVNDIKQLNLSPIFDRTIIAGAKKRKRVAFEPAFVQEKILADGAFDDLNDEARRVIYLVAETGLRLSEACNLTKETIVLDHKVPHVAVREVDREVKSGNAIREIPLVGVALMAMRAQPDGFPRYHDNADALSALVNKALDARKLLTKKGQSLYSLRHTFKDRLRAVEAPLELTRMLMGHSGKDPDYGQGYTLEHKRKFLDLIAFKPPSSV